MYGPFIGSGNGTIPVLKIVEEGSRIVYLAHDGEFTKIVKANPDGSDQEGFYYVGQVSQYGTIPLINQKSGEYNVRNK